MTRLNSDCTNTIQLLFTLDWKSGLTETKQVLIFKQLFNFIHDLIGEGLGSDHQGVC